MHNLILLDLKYRLQNSMIKSYSNRVIQNLFTA